MTPGDRPVSNPYVARGGKPAGLIPMPSPTPLPPPPPDPTFPSSDSVRTRFRCIGVRMLSRSPFGLTASPPGRQGATGSPVRTRETRSQTSGDPEARYRGRRLLWQTGSPTEPESHSNTIARPKQEPPHRVAPRNPAPKGSPCDLVWLVRAQLRARFIERLLQCPVPLGPLTETVLRVCR
jgi:hypothetical protein